MKDVALASDCQVRSVVRALDVLIAVSEPGPADLTTVARVADHHPATTLPMLESLRNRTRPDGRKGGDGTPAAAAAAL